MKRPWLTIAFWCVAWGLVLVGSAAAEEKGAYVTQSDAAWTIGNQSLELQFTKAEGRCTATAVVNRLAGRTIALKSDDFALGVEGRDPLRAADFTFRQAREETIAGGKRLTISCQAASGQELAIVYELGDGDCFLRRHLELTVKEPLPLRKVDVWDVGIDGTCSHQGFGEPVFLDDTFWGLEFPAAHNGFADGLVTLAQHPGRTISDRFVSKSVVLGVAEPGAVARRFRQYVDSFAVTPKDLGLFVNYNTWWTLMPPTEENCLALIDTFKKKLFEPYGESIDTFTIDDGWDNKNSLWDFREDRFPRGFAPLVEPLKAIHARQGLWLSPSSGYSHAPWGAANGYEGNSNPWFLCQSGPNYRRDIVKVVTGLARKYDMAFFKFDGFSATCEAPGHGHLPGPFAQEANTDAFIELITAVRQSRPGVYVDPTCGIWLSPWWLRYADSLWGSVSGDYPDVIVPAPVIRDSATTTRDAVFRQRCQEHPGYPPAAIEHLGIIVITPEKWEDNAMIVMGRGARLLTLYINPQFFRAPDHDWAFLASILRWARHNAPTLQNTELVLGDPMKREPYGYAHFRGDRGVIALRNPFIEPQQVSLKLDESCGWSRPEAAQACVVRIVYPRHETLAELKSYGDTLSVELQGYETMIVQLEPGTPQPQLLGVRYEVAKQEGNRITYTVYGRSGETLPVAVAGQARPTAATCDGQPVVEKDGKLTLAFAGQAQDCRAESGQLTAETTEAGWKLSGKCTVEVPQGSTARMELLSEPTSPVAGKPQCAAVVNGQAVEVRAVRSPDQGDQAHGKHPWTWFEFDLPEGRSEVAVSITPDSPTWSFFSGQAGWWLWAEHPLEKKALELEFAQPLPQAEADPLPMPIAMESQREIVAVQPAKTLRCGSRWPKGDAASVYLDEVPPDQCTQDWGSLQKNRSVWEKEMIVAGRKFARGLGTHANSRIVYELSGGRFTRFRSVVGRDEHAGDGRVVFEVWLDGKRLFDSGPMTQATPAKPVELDIAGGAVLELRTLDGGDGVSGDHGNWAEAQLVR